MSDRLGDIDVNPLGVPASGSPSPSRRVSSPSPSSGMPVDKVSEDTGALTDQEGVISEVEGHTALPTSQSFSEKSVGEGRSVTQQSPSEIPKTKSQETAAKTDSVSGKVIFIGEEQQSLFLQTTFLGDVYGDLAPQIQDLVTKEMVEGLARESSESPKQTGKMYHDFVDTKTGKTVKIKYEYDKSTGQLSISSPLAEGGGGLIKVIVRFGVPKIQSRKESLRAYKRHLKGDEELSKAFDESELQKEYEMGRNLASIPNVVEMRPVYRKRMGAEEPSASFKGYEMPLLTGGSLSKLLQSGGVRPGTQEYLNRLKQYRPIAEALAKMHDLSIVHSDVKPDNVLLDDKGSPQLTDFGTADYAEKKLIASTPQYEAPEIYHSNKKPHIDFPQDVFSLGIMLCEGFLQEEFDTVNIKKMNNEDGQAYIIGNSKDGFRDKKLDQLRARLKAKKGADAHMAKLILECIAENPDKRPLMTEVVKRLDTITAQTQKALKARPKPKEGG